MNNSQLRRQGTPSTKTVTVNTVVKKQNGQQQQPNSRRRRRTAQSNQISTNGGFVTKPNMALSKTLSATTRFESGKESLGALVGTTGFTSYSLMAHPDSFPSRIAGIAKQYAMYRLVKLKITITSFLAANDRGEFAVGFDYSSSATTTTDYTSNGDITTIGGVRMQAGRATVVYDVDCNKFTRRAFTYNAPHNTPIPGLTGPEYAFDILPGHIIIGVSGTPFNGQRVADVVAESLWEFNHPIKIPSVHTGNTLVAMFSQVSDNGKIKTYNARNDPTRAHPLNSSPYLAYTKEAQAELDEKVKEEVTDVVTTLTDFFSFDSHHTD